LLAANCFFFSANSLQTIQQQVVTEITAGNQGGVSSTYFESAPHSASWCRDASFGHDSMHVLQKIIGHALQANFGCWQTYKTRGHVRGGAALFSLV
jgi:hypothetical protein